MFVHTSVAPVFISLDVNHFRDPGIPLEKKNRFPEATFPKITTLTHSGVKFRASLGESVLIIRSY